MISGRGSKEIRGTVRPKSFRTVKRSVRVFLEVDRSSDFSSARSPTTRSHKYSGVHGVLSRLVYDNVNFGAARTMISGRGCGDRRRETDDRVRG